MTRRVRRRCGRTGSTVPDHRRDPVGANPSRSMPRRLRAMIDADRITAEGDPAIMSNCRVSTRR